MIRKFFTDKNNRVAVLQWPNIPLWAWIAATLLSKLTEGTVSSGFSAVASSAIIVWSVLEIAKGTSPFRRTLGAVVLTFVLLQLFT